MTMKYLKLFESVGYSRIYQNINDIDDEDAKDIKDVFQEIVDEYGLEYEHHARTSNFANKNNQYSVSISTLYSDKKIGIEACYNSNRENISMFSKDISNFCARLRSLYRSVKFDDDWTPGDVDRISIEIKITL